MADRRQLGHAHWKFLTWCADTDVSELRQLAVTVDRWWTETAAFIDTGHHIAKNEGISRVIKLVARAVFGSATPRAGGYGHVASPPAEPANTSAPLNFEDTDRPGSGPPGRRAPRRPA